MSGMKTEKVNQQLMCGGVSEARYRVPGTKTAGVLMEVAHGREHRALRVGNSRHDSKASFDTSWLY